MNGGDFVHVRLTQYAVENFVGDGSITVTSGRHHFTFQANTVMRVTRNFDWAIILEQELFDGKPLFEVIDESTINKPAEEGEKKKGKGGK